jgi:hypothetical protein
MHFVHVSYFKGSGRVARTVQYLSHREEQLPGGAKRELFGIGERYRALRGDERAIVQLLRQDGAHLKQPRYYRWRLTVPDAIAQRLAHHGVRGAEQALRDAVERTFRGAFRQAQGVFVVHHHGAGARRFGNPHVHALLSPVTALGTTYWVNKARLDQVKARWEREVLASLARLEHGLTPERQMGTSPPRSPGESLQRHGEPPPEMRDAGKPRRIARHAHPLPNPARTLLQMARDADQPGRSGERRARRITFRLLTPALPRELRTAAVLVRTAIRIGGGEED